MAERAVHPAHGEKPTGSSQEADLTNKEWNQVRQWRKQWKEEKEQNDKE